MEACAGDCLSEESAQESNTLGLDAGRERRIRGERDGVFSRHNDDQKSTPTRQTHTI